MTRRARTTLQRAKIFKDAGGTCHICECKIDGTREPWELEHVIPLEISGDDTDDNLRPAHVKCHRAKTTTDARDIAKCRRVAAKHNGAKPRKAKIPYRRFNGDPVWKSALVIWAGSLVYRPLTSKAFVSQNQAEVIHNGP